MYLHALTTPSCCCSSPPHANAAAALMATFSLSAIGTPPTQSAETVGVAPGAVPPVASTVEGELEGGHGAVGGTGNGGRLRRQGRSALHTQLEKHAM